MNKFYITTAIDYVNDNPNKIPVHQKEKNYFFKLSKYKQELIKDFEDEVVQILPSSKKKEILGKLKDELKDIAISREEVAWGIPIPWDNKQTIYVWVEALFNYYTATQFLENKKDFWPANLHLIGKDILWFHTVIWCALLKAADLPLPKVVFAHGFFSINGQKISKSLGNVISPQELVDRFGVDATRFLLVSQFPFGEDGDFSFDKLKESYNTNLANGLGNLVARVAKLCENARFKQSSTAESGHIILEQDAYGKAINACHFSGALDIVWGKITKLDKYINETKPWELLKQPEGSKKLQSIENILAHAVGQIQEISILIYPFMPETSEKIRSQFENQEIVPAQSLFPRIVEK
jgi:methionyl-tRNA synthetase